MGAFILSKFIIEIKLRNIVRQPPWSPKTILHHFIFKINAKKNPTVPRKIFHTEYATKKLNFPSPCVGYMMKMFWSEYLFSHHFWFEINLFVIQTCAYFISVKIYLYVKKVKWYTYICDDDDACERFSYVDTEYQVDY